MHAEIGFVVDARPDDRMLDPALGAGALLDMGIYPLTFAHLMLGPAERAAGDRRLSDAGSTSTSRSPAATRRRALGHHRVDTSCVLGEAAIATDSGRIDLDDFHHPSKAVFTAVGDGGTTASRPASPVEVAGDEPVIGQRLRQRDAEVGAACAPGLRESPLVPHEQTLTLLRQMDDLRRRSGVVYPGDR